MSTPDHIVLMGMMGAGKTTVGRALAARLHVSYADNDENLRSVTGLDAAALEQERGIDALHALEHEILTGAIRRRDGAVIGAPGSVALDPKAGVLLAGQRVVWLRARPETLAARVSRDPVRPLIGPDPASSMAALAAERAPGLARLASLVVDVDDLDVASVVERIVASLAVPG